MLHAQSINRGINRGQTKCLTAKKWSFPQYQCWLVRVLDKKLFRMLNINVWYREGFNSVINFDTNCLYIR